MSRAGNFTSSQIWKLMTSNKKGDSFGAPGMKYIKQVAYERQLGRSINTETSSRPTSWGSFVERYVFEQLPTEYQLVSKERLKHSHIAYWSGMPDLIKGNVVCDIKCPFSLEVFMDKIIALEDINTYKEDFPEDYWQHVSNSILLGDHVNEFEAIIFVPKKSDISLILEMARNFDGDQNKISWMNWADLDEFPYLPDECTFKSINIFKHEIPMTDKIVLIDRVRMANKLISENAY